ncbi:aldose epimerase family protein [Litoreibacter arenae]|uniref:Aldose 1-epimerase n=1 Tax=Litoreibacter arenae DSM 19593 TaxID=1123360 RepID=S9QQ57_9RHOB|nr:aldose epimerase family protein [Litoreibacter arenae]EPX81758.1 Aldose 1-epimerase [Litoreibacter arenae DSM 19593]
MRFGEMPDGSPVQRHRIEGGGLVAHVLSYGAVVQDLRLEGHDGPLVLGFEEFAPYLTDSPYFGAVVGRCANRIGGGRFELDGVAHQLDLNLNGRHHSHGGSKGVGKRNWIVESVAANSLTLRIDLADGEMGYPGNTTARCTYSCLEGGVFDIRLEAETDAPTLCNFAHHSYWNLDGGATTEDHVMQVDADRMTVVDADFIPTGEARDVTGTRYDFRTERPIRDEVFIDHNLCLSDTRQPLRRIGHLRSLKSGVEMQMRSTEPGLQVYDGYKLAVGPRGLGGRSYGASAGVALEPQVWPDAINNDSFPSAVLRPGETYRQQTQFSFNKE